MFPPLEDPGSFVTEVAPCGPSCFRSTTRLQNPTLLPRKNSTSPILWKRPECICRSTSKAWDCWNLIWRGSPRSSLSRAKREHARTKSKAHGYHQKGLCKGYVLEWNIAQNLQKRRRLFKRRQTLQLKFVDRFPFEQRTSRMVYHGVIAVWSLPVFPCLPFVSFLVFLPFLWQFLLASFPPSFLSVDPVFSFPILFFLLLHLHFVKFLLSASKYSFHPAVRFPVWFCVLERSQNVSKNEGKIHDKQLGINLARSWQTFFPVLLLLRQLPLPLRDCCCCCCWCSCCWCESQY